MINIISQKNIVPVEDYTKLSSNIITTWHSIHFSLKNSIPAIHIDKYSNSSIYFYVSHPPFSYYCLYIAQYIVSTNALLILNFCLTVISAIFVYLSVVILTRKSAFSAFSIYGFLALVLYSLQPAVIQYQVFNFHPDLFVQTLIIIINYIYLKLIIKERYHSIKYIMLFSIFVFLITYSSWYGVFYCFSITVIGLFNVRKGYKMIPYIIIVLISGSLAVLLTYIQYAQLDGWKQTIFNFKNIYLKESIIHSSYFYCLKNILYHLFKRIGLLLTALFILIIYSIIKPKQKILFSKNGYKYLIVSFVPVLLYNISLFNYAQNEYTTLYFVAPLCIIIAIWVEKIVKSKSI